MLRLLALSVFSSLSLSDGHKLLVVFPFPGKSHSILGEGYVRNLVKAGHEVTYVTPIPIKDISKNLTQIDVSSLFNNVDANFLSINTIMEGVIDVADSYSILEMMFSVSKASILHENVQALIHNSEIKFDAVIVEWLFSELYAGFSSVFGCPLIWSSSMDPHWRVLQLIDEIPNPALTVDLFSDNSTPLTFLERVTELWVQIKVLYLKRHFRPLEIQAYEKAFKQATEKRGRTLPAFEEVIFSGSLMLGNSHVSSGEPVKLPQSYKPVGGYYIDTNVKPLPDDLQKLMDSSNHGVIYFSLGTMLKSKDLPEALRLDLLKMFSELKQTVLWKFEGVVNNLPENVHVMQWAPQQSILAHPNTVLFITHGGLLSTSEAIHFGVPIIGIPGFGDQSLNVKRAVKKGFARKVDLSMETAKYLNEAIEDILSNPRYTEKVKELSFIYHDRPVSPGTELVHWVEHVIRTKGAPHLRSPALMVAWYQKIYLDLCGAIVLPTIVLIHSVKQFMSTRNIKSNVKKVN